MHIDKLRTMLLQASEQYKDLAESLDERGQPLTSRERQMVRAAMLPYVQDLAEGLVLAHLCGDSINWAEVQSNFESFSIL